jgi:hypothetical protein
MPTQEKIVTDIMNVLCVNSDIYNGFFGYISFVWCILRKSASRTVVKGRKKERKKERKKQTKKERKNKDTKKERKKE